MPTKEFGAVAHLRRQPADTCAARVGQTGSRICGRGQIGALRRSRRRFALAVAIVAVALAVPAVAVASWGWTGWVGVGDNNGMCTFSAYANDSACSPLSTAWVQNNASNSGPDDVHAGFENSSAIRGGYLSMNQSNIYYEIDYFSATANVQGEVTWCPTSGLTCNYGASKVWFQVS